MGQRMSQEKVKQIKSYAKKKKRVENLLAEQRRVKEEEAYRLVANDYRKYIVDVLKAHPIYQTLAENPNNNSVWGSTSAGGEYCVDFGGLEIKAGFYGTVDLDIVVVEDELEIKDLICIIPHCYHREVSQVDGKRHLKFSYGWRIESDDLHKELTKALTGCIKELDLPVKYRLHTQIWLTGHPHPFINLVLFLK